MANESKISSIVIPPIGCGVLTTPIRVSATGIQNGIIQFIEEQKEQEFSIKRIDLCLYIEDEYEKFEESWNIERGVDNQFDSSDEENKFLFV